MRYLCIYLKATTQAGWVELFNGKFNRLYIDLLDHSFLSYVVTIRISGSVFQRSYMHVDIHPVVCLSGLSVFPCSFNIVETINF